MGCNLSSQDVAPAKTTSRPSGVDLDAIAVIATTVRGDARQVSEKWDLPMSDIASECTGPQTSYENSVGREVDVQVTPTWDSGSRTTPQQQLSPADGHQRLETLQVELFSPGIAGGRSTADGVANTSRHSLTSVGYTVALEFPSEHQLDGLKQRLSHGAPNVPSNGPFDFTGPTMTSADGSSSTARLSVNSARSAEDAVPIHRDTGIPFFSASIFSPHTSQDMLELQRRLMGGYVDAESGREYLTPGQRWSSLHQELALAERCDTPPHLYDAYLTGAGILWISPQDGLPDHLVQIPKEDDSSSGEGRMMTAVGRKFEMQYHQLLIQLSGYIPELEDDISNSEVSLCSYLLQKSVSRVKEFYSWCSGTSPMSPNHQRLRVILGQLQVSLRDTAILLEDPKRYLEAFARIDPQGLMFQAEVLSFMQAPNSNGNGGRVGSASSPSLSVQIPIESERAETLPVSSNPLQRSIRVEVPSAGASTTSAAHPPPNPTRILAKKAKDIANLATSNLCSSRSSNLSESLYNNRQLETALGLFHNRSFRILDYILLILRNTVTLELLRRTEER